ERRVVAETVAHEGERAPLRARPVHRMAGARDQAEVAGTRVELGRERRQPRPGHGLRALERLRLQRVAPLLDLAGAVIAPAGRAIVQVDVAAGRTGPREASPVHEVAISETAHRARERLLQRRDRGCGEHLAGVQVHGSLPPGRLRTY